MDGTIHRTRLSLLTKADDDGKFCVVDFNRVSFFCSHHSFWIFLGSLLARVNVVVKSERNSQPLSTIQSMNTVRFLGKGVNMYNNV